MIHTTVPVKVWVDIDEKIVDFVIHLNTIEGVRTDASCQGSEEGPNPYRAYVMCHWTDDALHRLQQKFEVKVEGMG